jgi:two-component system, NarL family, nitrate/nitrite response regulator NarL
MNNNLHPIRIVIADEQSRFREEIRRSLESEPSFSVVGVASDPHGALKLTCQNRPDILLVDWVLAKACELKVLNEPATQLRPVRIVVTLTELDKSCLVEALRIGAHGVVLKRSTSQVLIKSVQSVMAGQYWLDRECVGVLIEALRDSPAQENGAKSPKDYGLTRREVDIITKIASGRSNKEVGEEFAISERTVKHHLTNIFGKVGVSSRLQLALFAVNQHLMGRQPSLSPQSMQGDEDI